MTKYLGGTRNGLLQLTVGGFGPSWPVGMKQLVTLHQSEGRNVSGGTLQGPGLWAAAVTFMVGLPSSVKPSRKWSEECFSDPKSHPVDTHY